MKNRSLIASGYKVFGIKYFLSFILLALTQLIFWMINKSYFNLASESILKILKGNLIFILSTLSIYLCVFILLSTLPVISLKKFRYDSLYQKFTSFFWLAPTFLMVFFNLVDVFWYETIGSRSSFSQLLVFFAVESKLSFIFSIIKTHFIPIILLIAVFYLLILLCKRMDKCFYRPKESLDYKYSRQGLICEIILFLLVVGGSFWFYRGYYKRCLRPIHAGYFSSLKNTDLVLNTPYILFKTIGKKRTKRIEFYSKDKVEELFSIDRNLPTQNTKLSPPLRCIKESGIKNVVILQIESLSAEYVGSYNPDSRFTPFIDSLIKKSVSWKGWANGNHTMAAPLSMNSSFPQYDADKFFFRSEESNTEMDSLSQMLKDHGFDTSFFFADKNGSMYLDVYALQSGFDAYYGKNEYDRDNPNNSDYIEGTWGILDEPFLKYSVEKLDQRYKDNKKPFYSYIITSTSHHPFLIPYEYKTSLPQGPLQIHQTIAYEDVAIREFFKLASTKDWYKDTIFIIAADHTGMSQGGVWATPLGQHSIPIIFYTPGAECSGTDDKLVSQVDIFPTVVDLFGFEAHILAYGKSIFDPEHENIGLTSSSISYIFVEDNYLLQCFDLCSRVEVFDTSKDPLNQDDLMKKIETLPQGQKDKILNMIEKTRASIQQFNNRMLDKKTVVNQ